MIKIKKRVSETRHHYRVIIYKLESNEFVYYLINNPTGDDVPFWLNPDRLKVVRVGMSGCVDFVCESGKYHLTMSGYLEVGVYDVMKFQKPVEETAYGWEELNEKEGKQVLAFFFMKFPFQLMEFWEKLELGEEVNNFFLPIRKTYERMEVIFQKGGLKIEDIPLSFKTIVKFNEQEIFTLPKIGMRKIEFFQDEYYHYTRIFFKYGYIIYYKQFLERETVYITKEVNGHPQKIWGWEKFGDALHPRCEISPEESIDDLLMRRLGDVIFYQCDVEGREDTFFSPDEFEKMKERYSFLKKISIREEGGKYLLFHPEHGWLFLPKGGYLVRQVRYIRRGHD